METAGSAIEMKPSDFLDLKNKKGVGKDTRYPLLCTISVVQFRRKSTKLYWNSFTGTVFKSGQFLQKKFREQCKKQCFLPEKGAARGVNLKKKDDILKKLIDLMPRNRRRFWVNLPSNEASADLSINLEHLAK